MGDTAGLAEQAGCTSQMALPPQSVSRAAQRLAIEAGISIVDHVDAVVCLRMAVTHIQILVERQGTGGAHRLRLTTQTPSTLPAADRIHDGHPKPTRYPSGPEPDTPALHPIVLERTASKNRVCSSCRPGRSQKPLGTSPPVCPSSRPISRLRLGAAGDARWTARCARKSPPARCRRRSKALRR